VTFLVAGTVTQVISFPARVPAAFLSVHKVITRMLILIEADVIEYEKLRFRSKIRRVGNARILKVQLRLAGDPARVPLVALARDRVDDIAGHDERGSVGERIHEYRVGIRDQQHVALVDGGPTADTRAVYAEPFFE